MSKILIVDDDLYIRESLKIILDIQQELQVVGLCEHGKACIEMLEKEQVDIVLLDLRMPVMSGIELLNYLKQYPNQYQHIKVLVLTTFDEEELIAQAIQLGACGYILKNSTPDKIISAIKAVALGNQVFESKIIQTWGEQGQRVECISDETKKRDYMMNTYQLSTREYEIVELIAEGLSNKEIATSLYISEGTVKNYITNILSKMELKHRTQIAITYLKIQ